MQRSKEYFLTSLCDPLYKIPECKGEGRGEAMSGWQSGGPWERPHFFNTTISLASVNKLKLKIIKSHFIIIIIKKHPLQIPDILPPAGMSQSFSIKSKTCLRILWAFSYLETRLNKSSAEVFGLVFMRLLVNVFKPSVTAAKLFEHAENSSFKILW